MIYPSIRQYIDALRMARRTFRSQNNRSITIILDKSSEPIYRVEEGCLCINVKVDDMERSLRLPLCSGEFIAKDNQEYFCEELLVVMGDKAQYYDMILGEAIEYCTQIDESTLQAKEDRVLYLEDGLWGYRSSSGDIIVEARYTEASEFNESRAVVVSTDGLYGLIDSQGNEIIAPNYDDISYDNSRYCIVERDGNIGVIDRLGREVLPTKFDWIADQSEGLFLVKSAEKYGYYSDTGEVAFELQYDNATSFQDGIAIVEFEGKRYQINREGQRVSPIINIRY